MAGATRPSFQSSNDRVTFTSPSAASSGTRTVPWKRSLQHRSLSTISTRTGGPPALRLGNSSTARGWTVAGMTEQLTRHGTIDQIVYRWSPRSLTGKRGVGPVATSLDADALRVWDGRLTLSQTTDPPAET